MTLSAHIYSSTGKQVASFKTVIMEQIAAAKIKVYEFPEVEDGEEAERKENRRMKVGFYHGTHGITPNGHLEVFQFTSSYLVSNEFHSGQWTLHMPDSQNVPKSACRDLYSN